MSRSFLLRAAALALAAVILLSSCSNSSKKGAPSPSQVTQITAEVGGSRTLPADFFGLNGANFIRGVDPTDPRFLSSLGSLAPESLRVFGGTTANYWNWQTGDFVDSVQLPKDLGTLPPAGMTLARWKDVLNAAGAQPIFDLNIISSTLPDQLAMLRTAQAMGLPVRRVELGNELYQNVPAVTARFPSPATYAGTAAQWTQAVKAAFPGAQVSVVGALAKQGSTQTARKQEWNTAVASDAASFDAVTLHLYFSPGTGSSPVDDQVAARAVANTAARMRQFSQVDLAGIPAGKTCWVTEFNIQEKGSSVPGTWLHGLLMAQVSIALASDARVGAAVMHALVGNPTFAAIFGGNAGGSNQTPRGTGQPYALTAAGEAMRLVFAASQHATSAQVVTFGSDPDVVGIAFRAGSSQRILIANLSAVAKNVNLAKLGNGAYHVVQLWDPPGMFVSGPGAVHTGDQSSSGTLSVQPWSLSLLT